MPSFSRWGLLFVYSLIAGLLTACEAVIVWEPPVPLPLEVGISRNGIEVSTESPEWVTPLGTFSIGWEQPVFDFIQEQKQTTWGVPRVLAIRVDDQLQVYALKPGTLVELKPSLDERYYRQIRLKYDPSDPDGDIILEVRSITVAEIIATHQPPTRVSPPPTKAPIPDTSREKPSACSGSPKRLNIGKQATVCTWNSGENVILREGPGKSYAELRRLKPGAIVTITGSAICDESTGWWYWPVRTRSGYTGWMAEGGDEKDPYFLCPVP